MNRAGLVFGSVCSGIEAASVAWEPLGWRAAFLSEIEPFPRAVLRHHYPRTPLHGDFTTIREDEYEAIDLLVGGTPCQDFSVAGKRKGLDGDRGNLTLQYALLARRLRPRWMVWENVPGAFTSNKGRDFGAVIACFAGYPEGSIFTPPRDGWRNSGIVPPATPDGYGLAWRVLDAQYVRVHGHGRAVPQRRRRVFVVGYLGDWRPAAAVLLERASLSGDSPPRRGSQQEPAARAAYGIDRDCLDRSGEGAGGTAGERSGLGIEAGLAQTLKAKGPGAVAACLNGLGEYGADVPTLRAKGGDAAGGSEALLAYGGNDTRGPIQVSTAVNAHGGPSGRLDFDSETFICAPTAATLTRGAESAGKGGYAGRRQEDDQNLVAHSLRADGFDASEDGTGRGTPLVPVALSVSLRGREGGGVIELGDDCAMALRASQGGGDKPHALIGHNGGPPLYAVRRLLPVECERLQAFRDGYTDILFRGKPAADGPRYKALGNSMATNVMRWLGWRIDMVEAILAAPLLRALSQDREGQAA